MSLKTLPEDLLVLARAMAIATMTVVLTPIAWVRTNAGRNQL